MKNPDAVTSSSGRGPKPVEESNMSSKAQAQSNAKKPTDRRILAQAEREEHTGPASGTREHFEAWQAEQEATAKAEATGSPELVALRKLAHAAESIFEFQGIMSPRLTPAEILGEALRCAQSDFAVMNSASNSESGM